MGTEPITATLRAWRAGERGAEERLLEAVYPDLRRRAAGFLRRERAGHTLQPTALVHEAYLRLLDQKQVRFQDRVHFFAIAARVMRRVLLDHARRRATLKRGGELVRVALEPWADNLAAPAAGGLDVESLDEALVALENLDPDLARLVELRFFAGLTVEETAEALGRSTATVVRQWRVARAFLLDRLAVESNGSPAAGERGTA